MNTMYAAVIRVLSNIHKSYLMQLQTVKSYLRATSAFKLVHEAHQTYFASAVRIASVDALLPQNGRYIEVTEAIGDKRESKTLTRAI